MSELLLYEVCLFALAPSTGTDNEPKRPEMTIDFKKCNAIYFAFLF